MIWILLGIIAVVGIVVIVALVDISQQLVRIADAVEELARSAQKGGSRS